MKPKARTIIERHGFIDDDRSGSAHDQIQIWAHRNFKRILKELFPREEIPDPLIVEFEFAIMDKNYVIGFVDLFCRRYAIGMEIKTKIPSVGDLIRQINFYRSYRSATWIVVSPDARFAKILEQQGIMFFRYKDQGELF